jgi:hypothetical protein
MLLAVRPGDDSVEKLIHWLLAVDTDETLAMIRQLVKDKKAEAKAALA